MRFPVFFVARTVIKRVLFTASLFQDRVFLCQLHFLMTQFELLCKHISAPSVKGLHFYSQTTKTEVCDCVGLSFSVMYSPFDCLFSGLSQFPSHSLLYPSMPPVVVETTAVRILSGVRYYL